MEYIRLVRFTLSQSSLSQASIMAQDLIPAIKQQPGCLSAVFFGGGDDGECGICVQWDGQEHADAAAAIISPRLEGHLTGNTAGQPERGLFPILAS